MVLNETVEPANFIFKINVYELEYIVIQTWIYENIKYDTPIFVDRYEIISWTKFWFYIKTLRYFSSDQESNHFC